MPHLQEIKRRDICGLGTGRKTKHILPGAHLGRRQRVGKLTGSTDADQHAKLGGKSGVVCQNRGGAVEGQCLARQFSIERRHHQPGATGDIGVHHRRHKGQPAGCLLGSQRAPAKRPRQG